MPRVGTGKQALWPVAVGDRTKKDSKAKTGAPSSSTAGSYTKQIRCWQAGLSPPTGASLVSPGSSDAPQEPSGREAPYSSNLTRAPHRTSHPVGGLRKPRASNSAGAANNGARVVVSDRLKSLNAATSFRKGDCNSRPTTPFPGLVNARIGRQGHAGPGGTSLRRWKPGLALNSILCSDARAGAAREG